MKVQTFFLCALFTPCSFLQQKLENNNEIMTILSSEASLLLYKISHMLKWRKSLYIWWRYTQLTQIMLSSISTFLFPSTTFYILLTYIRLVFPFTLLWLANAPQHSVFLFLQCFSPALHCWTLLGRRPSHILYVT